MCLNKHITLTGLFPMENLQEIFKLNEENPKLYLKDYNYLKKKTPIFLMEKQF